MSLLPDDQGRLLVALQDGDQSFVLRLGADGEPDASFAGGDGIAPLTTVPDGAGLFVVELGLDADGRILAAATAENADSSRDFAVVRLTEAGLPDDVNSTGFGPNPDDPADRRGHVQLDAGADDERAAGLVVQRDGTAIIVGDSARTDLGRVVVAIRLLPTGAVDDAYRDADRTDALSRVELTFEGLASTATATTLDDRGRLLVSGYGAAEGTVSGVARVLPSGDLDRHFGAITDGPDLRGSELLASAGSEVCDGGLHGVRSTSDRVLVLGTCGDAAVVWRLLDVSPISDLQLTMTGDGTVGAPSGPSTPTVLASPQKLPLSAIPKAALDESLAEIQSSPIRVSPIRVSPIRVSPIRVSPIRVSPIRVSPTGSAPTGPLIGGLPAVTLAQVPLAPPLDWDVIIADTPYADHPLQSVLVSDVMALSGTHPAIAALGLDRLDITRTAYGNVGLAAMLLGGTRLSSLPPPDGTSWCNFLFSQVSTARTRTGHPGPTCGNPTDATVPQRLTLLSLELAGLDLTPYFAQRHDLVGTTLADAPLSSVRLADMELSESTLGQVHVSALAQPSVFCAGSCGSTLAAAQASSSLRASATVGDLLDRDKGFVNAAGANALELGDLLRALLVREAVPYEALELESLLGSVALPARPTLSVTASVLASCNAAPDLTFDISLPAGARLARETLTLDRSTPAGSVALPFNVDAEAPEGVVRLRHPGSLDCGSDELSSRVSLTMKAQPGHQLGAVTARAAATAGGGLLLRNASLLVTDPLDQPDAQRPGALDDATLELGYLGRSGAADYYDVPVTPGSTVEVTLSHLPADYDLIVYDDLAQSAGGEADPIRNAPIRVSPIRVSPIRVSPIRVSGVDDSEPTSGRAILGIDAGPESLQGVPLLPKRVRAASAQRGLNVEAVRIQIRDGEPRQLLVAVVPYNGAQSSAPYVLRAETEDGPPLAACVGARVFKAGDPGVPNTLPSQLAPDTQSVILVNRARMSRLYGAADVEGPGKLWQRLLAFAAHPTVNGQVLDVGSDLAVRQAYADLDQPYDATNPSKGQCSVPAINQVVSEVNGLVDRLRPGAKKLRFVTMVGGDDALPLGRIPDLSDVANQSDYAPATRIGGKDNAVSRSFGLRYMLSDDPYGALAPSSFLETQLFVPDLATGRLVETPREITESLNEFLANDGIRTLNGSYVASYDFLADLGADVAAFATGNISGTHSTDNRENWKRNDAAQGMEDARGGLISVNGHYDNNRALPADQNAKGTEDELLTATEDLPFDSNDPAVNLANGILATVGCNAGINLSDLLLSSAPSAKDVARTSDWAQKVSAAKGVLVANTGFGYGDDVAMAYSEKLISGFARHLDGTMTVGQALQFAKQDYFEGAVFGVYDHKALQQATFYGLPQWRVGALGKVAATVLPGPPSGVSTPTLAVSDLLLQPRLQRRNDDRGDWFQVGTEQPQITAFRPVQPRTDVPLAPRADGLLAHGATLESLKTREVPIDPVIARPIVDDADLELEPDVGRAFFPETMQQVVSRTTPAGRVESLVLVPGQYRDVPIGSTKGVQRLVDATDVRVFSSDSDDFAAPRITSVDGVVDPAGDRLAFSVAVEGPDTARVFVLFLPEAGNASDNATPGGTSGTQRTWQKVELTRGTSGVWGGSAPLDASMDRVGQFYVQAVDRSGNVAVNSKKGVNFTAAPLPQAPDFALTVARPTASQAEVTVVPASQSLAGYVSSVDGGNDQPVTGPVPISGRGTHRVLVTSPAGTQEAVLVTISGAPVVTILTPSDGGTYDEGLELESAFSCADETGPVQCSGPATLAKTPGQHTFTVTIGGVAATTVTYTVRGTAASPSPSPTSPSPTATRTASPTPRASASPSRSASPGATLLPQPGGGDGLPGISSPEPGQASSSASPSPSTSASASPSPSGGPSVTIRLSAGTIAAGTPAAVQGKAPPGSRVVLWAYSRPSTTYQAVRRLTAPADGQIDLFVFPRGNTRMYLEVDGVAGPSVVLLVRPHITMAVRRVATMTYVFTGRVTPARKGIAVTLYRRTPRRDVITSTAFTDELGRFALIRRFGERGSWSFLPATGNSLNNAPGRGQPRPLRIS